MQPVNRITRYYDAGTMKGNKPSLPAGPSPILFWLGVVLGVCVGFYASAALIDLAKH